MIDVLENFGKTRISISISCLASPIRKAESQRAATADMALVRFARLPSLPYQETLFPLQFAHCRRTINIPLLSIITSRRLPPVRCSIDTNNTDYKNTLRTCKNCKSQFDPSLNHPCACRFHTAHFGGETKRKFESVYSGGTMNTPDSGRIFEYWHCCGSEDPFDLGCTAAPHISYDE